MIKTHLYIALLAFVCSAITAMPACAQDEVQIGLSLDRSTIRADESATLTVTVAGESQQLPEPKLPPLPMFEIFSAGSSTNIQIVNGQVTSNLTYRYILYPKREGKFPIRSAHLVYNGKRYESNELSITVTKAGSGAAPDEPAEQDAKTDEGDTRDVFLTTEVDKKTAFVDEQITLRVKLYRAIRTLSTPDYEPPQTPGFWSQDIPPQKTYTQTINGRNYTVNEIRMALFPTRPGDLTISPARVTVTVPDRSRRRTRDPFSLFDDMFQQGKRVSVQSRPITVSVKPLPIKGKTDQFSGGVGRYGIMASVDKTEAQVNEAITLTVKIAGQGNVKSIPEPTIPEMDGFRVEQASSDYKVSNFDEQIGGWKTYEYLLLPRVPGAQRIEPIVLNYFDPSKKEYATVRTEPIELMINQGEDVAGTDVPYNMVAGQTINLKETDIRFIKVDNGHLSRRGGLILTSPWFLAILALPLLVVVGGMIDVRRKRRLQSDIAYARRRRAASEAKKRLKQAEKDLQGNNDSRFYAELSTAIYQFVADKFNRSAQGLTSDGVEELLKTQNVSDELLQDTLDVIRQADFGRFAGGARVDGTRRDLFDRAQKVITGLGEQL